MDRWRDGEVRWNGVEDMQGDMIEAFKIVHHKNKNKLLACIVSECLNKIKIE